MLPRESAQVSCRDVASPYGPTISVTPCKRGRMITASRGRRRAMSAARDTWRLQARKEGSLLAKVSSWLSELRGRRSTAGRLIEARHLTVHHVLGSASKERSINVGGAGASGVHEANDSFSMDI